MEHNDQCSVHITDFISNQYTMAGNHRIFIGLGSNVGNRDEYLALAVQEMKKADVMPVRKSSVYQSQAWGYLDQPPFLNQVIEVNTVLSPEHLLLTLQVIEKKMGRRVSKKWREREIDLDILYFGDKIIDTDMIQIPHAYVHERNFVLIPLSEIASDFTDPRSGATIHDLVKSSTDDTKVTIYQGVK